MKTVLTSIITSIITVIIAFFVVHAIWGDGDCMFNHDDDHDGCCEKLRKECLDKYHKRGDFRSHAMIMKRLVPLRAEFEEQLTDEEKATIEAIQDKFEDADDDHEKMRPEGMAKFKELYEEDIAALLAIANKHQQFFDELSAKKYHPCPEAAKCKGDTVKTAETKEKCEKAKAECKEKINTFKVHFLLLDEDECEHDDDDDDDDDDD